MEKPVWNGSLDHTTMDSFTRKRYEKFLDKQAEYNDIQYQKRQSWARDNPNWKTEMEAFQAEKPGPNFKVAESLPEETGTSAGLLAIALAESLRPNVAGDGSDTLPPDEQQKKDAANKRAKALLAKRK